MLIISPQCNLVPQEPGMQGVLEQIEKAGRVCYKSEGKTKYDSNGRSLTAAKFFEQVVRIRKHGSVAEHGTVYMVIDVNLADGPWKKLDEIWDFYRNNPHSRILGKVINKDRCRYFITTNYRVILENDRMDDLQYMVDEPEPEHYKRYTFNVVTSIDISREWNRHRSMSISEQSTRFCDYLDIPKFDGHVKYIKPSDKVLLGTYLSFTTGKKKGWLINGQKECFLEDLDPYDYCLLTDCCKSETEYFELRQLGIKPELARKVLPLQTATEVYYTAFLDEWWAFLDLRLDPSAHPDIRQLAQQIKNQLPMEC
jgi:thymidylate synthase (FAD)